MQKKINEQAKTIVVLEKQTEGKHKYFVLYKNCGRTTSIFFNQHRACAFKTKKKKKSHLIF